jgi:hypothetical protein
MIQSDDGNNLSEYWQNQCENFYSDLYRTLPEDSIKPLALEGTVGEKSIDIVSFSNIIITEIAAQIVTSLLIKAIKEAYNNWSEYRQNDYIVIKYPDESMIKISNSFLSKLLQYSEKNPQLSIFEVLNHFKNFKE